MNTRIRRLSALNYFGGKSRYLDWLLPLIPDHEEYFEAFLGSGSIFLNKKPAIVETICDKDGRLINFFRVLRDNPDELIYQLSLTPYSREEFQLAGEESENPVEDARRYFIRSIQSFGGITHNKRRYNSYRMDVQQSRNGVAACVSKFLTKIQYLPEVVHRLRMAQIDNRDALQLMPAFNRSTTFIYQDPPYLHSTRTSNNDYKHEFTREQHLELAEINRKSRAMIMISHYDNPLYDFLYKPPYWTKILGPVRKANISKSIINREAVWINYAHKLKNHAKEINK